MASVNFRDRSIWLSYTGNTMQGWVAWAQEAVVQTLQPGTAHLRRQRCSRYLNVCRGKAGLQWLDLSGSPRYFRSWRLLNCSLCWAWLGRWLITHMHTCITSYYSHKHTRIIQHLPTYLHIYHIYIHTSLHNTTTCICACYTRTPMVHANTWKYTYNMKICKHSHVSPPPYLHV